MGNIASPGSNQEKKLALEDAQDDALNKQFMHSMTPAGESVPPTIRASVLCHIMLLESVLERTANRIAEAQNLTLPQWMALGCVGHNEDGITHSELSRRLMLSKAPITGVVDRLQRAGLVRRVADGHDRRVSRIVITDHGRKMWQNVRDLLTQNADEMFVGLAEDEQEILVRLLARLLEAAAKDDPTLANLHCPVTASVR